MSVWKKLVLSLFLSLILVSICDGLFGSHTPKGVCFVPTKLDTPAVDLESLKPLISPTSAGYDDAWNEFIIPMIHGIPKNLEIMNTSDQYVGDSRGETRKQRNTQYRNMMKKIEVYYIDHFNNPEQNDISVGIWSVFFGQFVFKFMEPIPGMPQMIIFNGLLPAIGVTYNIEKLRQYRTNGKPTENQEENEGNQAGNGGNQEYAEDIIGGQDPSERRSLAESDDGYDDDGESIKYPYHDIQPYPQFITNNGKSGGSNGFRFWVIHNDPDPNTAYAITVSTDKDKLWSNSWTDKKHKCTKGGAGSAMVEFGDCSSADGDIHDYINRYLSKYRECQKIILCKDGAKEFRFESTFGDIDKLYVSAAKVSGSCGAEDKECLFQHLIEVHITKEEEGRYRCPKPSMALDFECKKPFFRKEDIFGEYDFYQSYFYGAQFDYKYRVVPPENINKASRNRQEGEEMGEEEETNDPFGCKKVAAKSRPRLQLQTEKENVYTCCINEPPVKGTAASLPYYWPETRQFGSGGDGEGSDEFGAGGSPNADDEDPRTRNKIPMSAIVGKAPRDKDFPNENIRQRVVGYRKDHGMREREAYDKPVTKEEYEAIIKNEELVKNPANPDEHAEAENNSNISSILQAYGVFIATFSLIGVSSLFVVMKK